MLLVRHLCHIQPVFTKELGWLQLSRVCGSITPLIHRLKCPRQTLKPNCSQCVYKNKVL